MILEIRGLGTALTSTLQARSMPRERKRSAEHNFPFPKIADRCEIRPRNKPDYGGVVHQSKDREGIGN